MVDTFSLPEAFSLKVFDGQFVAGDLSDKISGILCKLNVRVLCILDLGILMICLMYDVYDNVEIYLIYPLDPDPHDDFSSDPDQLQNNADPKHWFMIAI